MVASTKPIKIKPSHKGDFTAWAKAHGMTVSEAANKVMSAPLNEYSAHVRQMANFAKNFGGKGK